MFEELRLEAILFTSFICQGLVRTTALEVDQLSSYARLHHLRAANLQKSMRLLDKFGFAAINIIVRVVGSGDRARHVG